MTITLYVDWDYQEIYKNDDELVNGYIEHYCADDRFRCWLDDEYTSDEIFAMTQSQKEEAEKSYRNYLIQCAREWAYDNNMEQEVEI